MSGDQITKSTLYYYSIFTRVVLGIYILYSDLQGTGEQCLLVNIIGVQFVVCVETVSHSCHTVVTQLSHIVTQCHTLSHSVTQTRYIYSSSSRRQIIDTKLQIGRCNLVIPPGIAKHLSVISADTCTDYSVYTIHCTPYTIVQGIIYNTLCYTLDAIIQYTMHMYTLYPLYQYTIHQEQYSVHYTSNSYIVTQDLDDICVLNKYWYQ